jgi:hypothetical protein
MGLLGVTVMVAVTGTVVKLVAVKDGILPVPLAASPMDVVLFVQLYVYPGTELLKFTAAVLLPEQTVWLTTAFTSGVAYTLICVAWNGRQAGSAGAGLRIAYTYCVPGVLNA